MFAFVPGVQIKSSTVKKIISFYVNFAFALSLLVIVGYIFGFGVDSYGRASIKFETFYKDQNYLSAYLMPPFAVNIYDVFFLGKDRSRKLIYCASTVIAVFIMGSRGSFLTILCICALVLAKVILKDGNLIRKAGLLILLGVFTAGFYFFFRSLPVFSRMTEFIASVRFFQVGQFIIQLIQMCASGYGQPDLVALPVILFWEAVSGQHRLIHGISLEMPYIIVLLNCLRTRELLDVS